jgi:hypothetical protein
MHSFTKQTTVEVFAIVSQTPSTHGVIRMLFEKTELRCVPVLVTPDDATHGLFEAEISIA